MIRDMLETRLLTKSVTPHRHASMDSRVHGRPQAMSPAPLSSNTRDCATFSAAPPEGASEALKPPSLPKQGLEGIASAWSDHSSYARLCSGRREGTQLTESSAVVICGAPASHLQQSPYAAIASPPHPVAGQMQFASPRIGARNSCDSAGYDRKRPGGIQSSLLGSSSVPNPDMASSLEVMSGRKSCATSVPHTLTHICTGSHRSRSQSPHETPASKVRTAQIIQSPRQCFFLPQQQSYQRSNDAVDG